LSCEAVLGELFSCEAVLGELFFCEAVLLGELFSWVDKSAERSACSGNKLRSDGRAPFEEEAGVSEGEEPVKGTDPFDERSKKILPKKFLLSSQKYDGDPEPEIRDTENNISRIRIQM
jgi:hypothetical protein